jgi:hypothetical protein
MQHALVEVLGGELGGTVAGEYGDDQHHLAADQRVTMVLVLEHVVSRLAVLLVVHEQRALVEQLPQSEQRAVDGLTGTEGEAAQDLVVDLAEPELAHLRVAGRYDLEAGTDGLGSRLANEHLRIAQSDPDDLEDLGDPLVHERRGVLGQLAQDQHGSEAARLLALQLQPLQRALDLGLDQLGGEGAARLREAAQRFGGHNHGCRILAAHDGAQVRGEARRLLAGIVAAKVDERIERVDAADAFVGVATRDDEARDFRVDVVVEARKDIGRELCAASVGAPDAVRGGELASVRGFDRLAQTVRALLARLIIPTPCERQLHTGPRTNAYLERNSSTMRSSEDDACCDMATTSPEAPRGVKQRAAAVHGKDTRACGGRGTDVQCL